MRNFSNLSFSRFYSSFQISIPDATSKGPCAFRSSFTASMKSRPPAFSRALPADEHTTGKRDNYNGPWAFHTSKKKRPAGLAFSPTPSLRSISAFVGLMIPSTLMVPILLISLSVSESCFRGCRVEVITKSLRTLTRVTYVQGEWLGYLYKRCDRMTCHYWHATTFNDTFCPRNRLFAERIVNPSPGPSSTVELATTASLSFSVFFFQKNQWKTEHTHASYRTITNTLTNIEMFAAIHVYLPSACGLVCLCLFWWWVSWCSWRAPPSSLARSPECPLSLGCPSSWTAAQGGCEAGPLRLIWSPLWEAERPQNRRISWLFRLIGQFLPSEKY